MPLRQDVVKRLKEAADAVNEVKPDSDSSARWWSDPTMLVTNGPLHGGDPDREYPDPDGKRQLRQKNHRPDELVFHFSRRADRTDSLRAGACRRCVASERGEMAARLTADETWQADPVLETYSVLFNWNRLEEDGIRRALSLAIDRDAIAALAGITGKPAAGLVPPGVPGGGAGLPHQRRRFDRHDLRGLCRPLHAGGAAHAGGRL